LTGKPASRKMMMLVLWIAGVVARAQPAIRAGVFDAMAADDYDAAGRSDLIVGQGWVNRMQHRLGPPGSSSHWSRVIDALLAIMIAMLRPPARIHGVGTITLLLWPTLLLAAMLLLVPTIAGRGRGGGAQHPAGAAGGRRGR